MNRSTRTIKKNVKKLRKKANRKYYQSLLKDYQNDMKRP